ncbi:hypothetical protein TcasGA2_TC008964 [Tribolium castaneum]|uniref:Uncharacterized protein n=1 Tax=Tribolium castaneum TaxID=7070 RepID=D6WQ65_TRICA|nr:PREDICTED: claspin [Tribolium castaneum]EFA06121.1 hypothetical protein TcasGA2_TC008964 [Tribolium castaneum]|eukprot:XP_008195746.1 PREDICTED: claspin [Tribolium castaneum]
MEITQDKLSEHSEDENEMNTLNVNKVRKKHNVIDSDSEAEENDLNEKAPPALAEPSDDEEKTSIANSDVAKKKLKRISRINSDSDEEKDHNESVIEEEEITPHNKSFPDEATAVEALIYTTNSKGELVPENGPTNAQKSRYSLYDSESSEDERVQTTFEDVDETELPPTVYRKSRKNADKPKRMTPQEAAKQKIEIQSESQRMLRESNVSLPYHKPKSYTIKEFLQKRAKLASALPLIPKAPPSVAIKMSKDQLEEVSKKLDERIKEVEEFYKSESEEEDDDTKETAREVRSWLDFLVDKAVDSVESKMRQLLVEESGEKKVQDQDKNYSSDLFDQEDPMECSHNEENSEVPKEIEEIPKKANTLELLRDKLNVQPRLSGTPDDIIDLEAGVTKPNEVKKLVEKYFQHTAKKVSHKHKVHLDVLGVGKGGEIIKETVSMNVDDEEEEPPLVETPGAKLQRLREELQVQMAQKRLEMWKQKQDQGDILVSEKKLEDEDGNTEKDILDDEDEEFEMTESESEEEEDEEEYDLKPEKPKVKSAFIDTEVEDDDPEEINEDDEETGMDIVEENEDDIENDADDEAVDNEDLESPRRKVLRRIVKPFTEDSDDEETESGQKIVKYYATDDDDLLPPNLLRVNTTPQRPQIEKNKSEFDFLTPVTYLTGLQNLNSDSKLNHSPSESENNNSFSEKFAELPDTQGKIDELAELCSGKFPETQNCVEKVEELPPTTQELLNVCSGDFVTMTESGDTVSQFAKPSDKLTVHTSADKEIKNLDEDQDQIISQLLDEDELERFKKKFESPVNPTVRKTQLLEDIEEVNATGLINSDDENDGLEVKKKKRQKKLVFSDDEENSEIDETEPEEEEIDLHDNVIDDEEQQLENEVAAQESSNFKLGDFLDQEAELSESEWGSADEDEKGLDELDFEEGDEDKFNEKKIRTEIERIHMRQMLDEDNREVKILQELLLEDGELHGTGRKRQFRWKALDSQDNGEFDKKDDDDIFLDEEESEEHFRKMRHKREMFLKKKVETDDDDTLLSDSKILKVGQKLLQIKSSTSQSSTPAPSDKTEEANEPFSLLLTKRGSFLTRKDHVLQRLAEYNKVTTVGSTAKNSKRFVFQTIATAEESITVKDNNNKRKAAESTPIAIKKLRLDDLSPAGGKKGGQNPRAKKLFGKW